LHHLKREGIRVPAEEDFRRSYVEPTMQLDLYCEKPWALCPALASMNFISLSHESLPEGPGLITEDSLKTLKELYNGGERKILLFLKHS